MRALLAIAILAAGLARPGSARAELPAELEAAWRAELPDEMAEAAEPGALSGSGAWGRWTVSTGQMDGAGAPEVVLVVLPAGRPGKVRFLAEREGKDPEKKTVKLKGPPLTHATVAFLEFADGQAVAHVDGGPSGQVILSWDGKKLREISKIGKVRDDERHWFVVEDLDGDGVSEIIRYFRRELDVYTNEDELAGEGGAAAERQGKAIDAVAVWRRDDGKWKKDKALLESVQ